MRSLPLSLYVHLPWCLRKCPYCDFNSHALRGALPERAYVTALLEDLDEELSRVPGRGIETVFFGGGTPSLFAAPSLSRLIETLRARAVLADGAEITVEANPGTVEHGRFADLRRAGITRVSLGVQSFDDDRLKSLGRIHGEREVWAAIGELARAGVDNVNLDLMYGLPGQSVEGACEDLRKALTARPAHISHYQLTLEPNTRFWHQPPELPGEEEIWEIQTRCRSMLDDGGYEQYEVSAWARPGRRCAHNLNYWRYGDYLGIGAGAHGKLTLKADILRRSKRRHPGDYLKAGRDRVMSQIGIGADDRVFEFMLNALRLVDGFDRALFEHRTGLPLDAAAPGLATARAAGLLESQHGRWRASALGWRFLDDLQSVFLPAGPAAHPGDAA